MFSISKRRRAWPAWLALAASVVGARAETATFTYKDFVSLIQTRDVRSIEDAIPFLPANMRSNVALMARSRSIQGASAQNPRAILFSDDGSMVVTFNGDVTQRGGDHIEVVSFDEAKAHFQFSTITFGGGTKARVIDNAQNCFGCHGRVESDLHPVWDPGLVCGERTEATMILSFRQKSRPKQKRMPGSLLAPPLKQDIARSISQTELAGRGPRESTESPARTHPHAPTSETDRTSNFRNCLSRKIRAGVRAMLPCAPVSSTPVVLSPAVHTQIETNLNRYLDAVFDSASAAAIRSNEAPSLILAQDVGHWLGVDITEWPMTVEKGTFAAFDSSFQFRDLLAGELLRQLGFRDFDSPKLIESSLALPSSPALAAIDRLGSSVNVSTELCSKL